MMLNLQNINNCQIWIRQTDIGIVTIELCDIVSHYFTISLFST